MYKTTQNIPQNFNFSSQTDMARSELDNRITRAEIIQEISSLKNNKAISFDRISNEILKAGKLVLVAPMLKLFNSILSSALYPSDWKRDILTPLHKSGEKSDPNNFRGLGCFLVSGQTVQ